MDKFSEQSAVVFSPTLIPIGFMLYRTILAERDVCIWIGRGFPIKENPVPGSQHGLYIGGPRRL